MNIEIYALRLFLALLIGGLMGLERQMHHRMAGTRTHALVAGGGAAFVMTAALIQGDPSAQGRIVSYIISGVGFLGAGVIFKEGGQIQGLNTAASIWCAAAVGTLAGLGFPLHAAVTAAGVLTVNAALRPLAYKFRPTTTDELAAPDQDYRFEFVCRQADESGMRMLLLHTIDRSPVRLHDLQSEEFENNGHRKIKAGLRTASSAHKAVEELAARFSMETCITSVGWWLAPPDTSEAHKAG